jgi:hypothetical protein
MSYVDDLVNAIEYELGEATVGLNGLHQHGPAIIRQLVNVTVDTFLPVPGAIKNRIADLLIADLLEMISYSRDSIKYMEKAAHMLGSPDALRAAAQMVEDSADKASIDLAADVRPDSLKAMMDSTKWDGEASQLYEKSFLGQNDAVARIATYGAVVEDALGKLADAIEQFYGELVVGVGTLVAAILAAIGAVIAAATVAGIPFAIGLAVGACVSAIASAVSLILMIMTIMQDVSGDIGKLHSSIEPWPKANFVS